MNSLKLYDASRTDAAIMLTDFLIEDEIQLIHSNYYSVLWVQEGQGDLITDFFNAKYCSGEIYCFNNYQAFALAPQKQGKIQVLRFHPNFFCIETYQHEVGCNGILFNDVYDATPIVIDADLSIELQTLFSQVGKEQYKNDHAAHELLFSYLKIILIRLTRAKSTHHTLPSELPVGEKLNELVLLINHNYQLEHRPAFYADALHQSVKTLNNNCKKYFNKTLSALICEKILIKGKWQLLHTDDSIKVVASGLGFKDEYYFSRFFKKHVGLSPKHFRDEEWRIRKGFLSIP